MTPELPTAEGPRPDRCETCRFWNGLFKICHRYPVVSDADADHWCGEWQGNRGEQQKGEWHQFIDGIGPRIKTFLAEQSITSFDDLLTADQPNRCPGFGDSSFHKIVLRLYRFGFSPPPHWKLSGFTKARLRRLKDELGK